MEILVYPNPDLRRTAMPVPAGDEALDRLAEEMLAQMYASRGVGLAAPQVGLAWRLLVYNPSGDPARRDEERVLMNPRIVARKGEEYGEEGCLSLPGIYGEVRRATWVKMEASDRRGQPLEMEFTGFEARVFQHELDHLEGILFIDRMEPAARLKIRRPLEQLEQEFRDSRALRP